jgi:hypothetical protein
VRFLISRSVANLGGMAAGSFMVHGAERFVLGGTKVGTLTVILVGDQAVMNHIRTHPSRTRSITTRCMRNCAGGSFHTREETQER